MASNDDGGVIEEDSCKTKESSSANNETLTNFDLQSLLMKIQANVAQNSQVLASLVAERSSNSFEYNEDEEPMTKRSKTDQPSGGQSSQESDDGSLNVASMKATHVASTNANIVASTNANFVASTNANDVASMNASTAATSAFRPSDDDVMSLFGGPEFDTVEDEAVDLDNNALLSMIGDALVPSDIKGPPILEHLAGIVDTKFTAEFDLEKRKEILDKYKVPKNCNSLFAPKVNPEIWGKLSSYARRNDVRTSTMQDTLLRITGAISSSIEDLLKAREEKKAPDYKPIIAKLFDTIAILGHLNKELSFKRREALKPNLSHEFKQACSRNLKPGKFLFGDDLPETMKTLRATARIVSSATKSNDTQQNFRSNRNYSGYQSSQSKPFLGQRGRMQHPSRMQYPQRSYNNQQQNFQPQQQLPRKKFTKN